MPILIKGWNPFYEGWLARVFDLPCPNPDNHACRDGWEMGEDTPGTDRVFALIEELHQNTGHVIITQHEEG